MLAAGRGRMSDMLASCNGADRVDSAGLIFRTCMYSSSFKWCVCVLGTRIVLFLIKSQGNIN